MIFFLNILACFILYHHSANGNSHVYNQAKCRITYKLNGGRFGDNLASYARAKWISYFFKIPLLHQPFPYSDQLKLHVNDKILNKKSLTHLKKNIYLHQLSSQTIELDKNILYISHWHTNMGEFGINFKDPKFIKILKRNISPRFDYPKIHLSDNYFNLAVHIRTGGDFLGDQDIAKRDPLRFPPLNYYITYIKKVAKLVEKPLYVYIFTDDSHPELLAKHIRHTLNNNTIFIDYTKSGNQHNKNVVTDFFNMMRFDGIIRAGSHFSMWAQRLGSYKIVIAPKHAQKIDNTWYVDEVFYNCSYMKKPLT